MDKPENERPDFLANGWGHFLVRMGFGLAFLTLMAVGFFALSGLHTRF